MSTHKMKRRGLKTRDMEKKQGLSGPKREETYFVNTSSQMCGGGQIDSKRINQTTSLYNRQKIQTSSNRFSTLGGDMR